MLRAVFDLRTNTQILLELLGVLKRFRVLIFELARREITDRYTGQLFGSFWTFVHPAVVILVYVFLFNVVFESKTAGTQLMPLDKTTYILAGIIPWLCFAEALGKASTVIIVNANLVKQVIFPVEVLPIKGVVATLFTEIIFILLFTAYKVVSHHTLWLMYLLLPVVLLFQTLAMIGVSYILCSIGTYFRDTKDMVQVFLSLGVWFIPVLYLPEAIPGVIRPLLYANPTTYLVWCFQDIFFYGRIAHPAAWVVFPLLSLLSFFFGYRLFRKFKTMFGNVL